MEQGSVRGYESSNRRTLVGEPQGSEEEGRTAKERAKRDDGILFSRAPSADVRDRHNPHAHPSARASHSRGLLSAIHNAHCTTPRIHPDHCEYCLVNPINIGTKRSMGSSLATIIPIATYSHQCITRTIPQNPTFQNISMAVSSRAVCSSEGGTLSLCKSRASWHFLLVLLEVRAGDSEKAKLEQAIGHLEEGWITTLIIRLIGGQNNATPPFSGPLEYICRVLKVSQ